MLNLNRNHMSEMNTPDMNCGCPMPGMECPPVYECPQERIVNCQIHHHVPHIQPIHTRVINHHIYRHTCTPCFTSSEENVVCNVFDNHCCQPRV